MKARRSILYQSKDYSVLNPVPCFYSKCYSWDVSQRNLHQYPLHRISYCADDKAEKRFFSFIAKEADSDKHTCFVFVSDKLVSVFDLPLVCYLDNLRDIWTHFLDFFLISDNLRDIILICILDLCFIHCFSFEFEYVKNLRSY